MCVCVCVSSFQDSVSLPGGGCLSQCVCSSILHVSVYVSPCTFVSLSVCVSLCVLVCLPQCFNVCLALLVYVSLPLFVCVCVGGGGV